MADLTYVAAAVEGDVDEVVLRRILEQFRAEPYAVYGKRGKHYLGEKLNAYNQAAGFGPWFVIRDLDHDANCAPQLCAELLPHPARLMCFRIAVREIESWLMADAERLSEYVGVPIGRVPANPETLDHPKRELVDLARRSRFRTVREDMVPRPESGRAVGPAYSSRMIEYASRVWRPRVAERNAPSLRRCRQRVGELVVKATR